MGELTRGISFAELGTGMPFCCRDTLESLSTDHPKSQGVGGDQHLALQGWQGRLAGRYGAASAHGTGAAWVRSWEMMSVTAPDGMEHPSSEPQCDPTVLPCL